MLALVDALPAGVVDSARVQSVTVARVDTKLVPELVYARADAPAPRRYLIRTWVGRRHRHANLPVCGRLVRLGRCAPDVLGPGTLRPFAEVEFHEVALFQILETFAIHGAAVKKVLLPRIVLDEPESLFHA